MTREELVNAIAEAIENMDDAEAVSVWNSFCDETSRYDDRIEEMEMIPELFCDLSEEDNIFNLLNRFYFGHDNRDEKSSANPNRDYFYFNGYGNIVSTDYPKDYIESQEVAEWIAESGDALGNDEIQELLDSASDEEEEG